MKAAVAATPWSRNDIALLRCKSIITETLMKGLNGHACDDNLGLQGVHIDSTNALDEGLAVQYLMLLAAANIPFTAVFRRDTIFYSTIIAKSTFRNAYWWVKGPTGKRFKQYLVITNLDVHLENQTVSIQRNSSPHHLVLDLFWQALHKYHHQAARKRTVVQPQAS